MDGRELRGCGKGSVPAGQGNYTILYHSTEIALLWTPIEAGVLINYNRGILTMYGEVDHMTYSSRYSIDNYRDSLLSWLKLVLV